MNIEIKSWIAGKALFAWDCENNTIKLTMEAAVRAGARLDGASLDGASLDGASLDGARLDGAEKLIGNRSIFQIGPIGSRCAYLVAYLTDEGMRIRAGCFFGSLDEFESAVTNEHGDNIHGAEYRAAVALIKAHAELWGSPQAEKPA